MSEIQRSKLHERNTEGQATRVKYRGASYVSEYRGASYMSEIQRGKVHE